jgi:hypothetical protein
MHNSKTKIVGSLDEFHSLRRAHHRSGIAVRSGEKAVARGWITTSDKRKIRRVFIDAGGRLQRVAYGFPRKDVALKLGPSYLNVGFEGTIDIPDNVGPAIDIFVRALVEEEKEVAAHSTIHVSVRVISPAQPLSLKLNENRAVSRIRRLADELPGEPFFGRSRRSVRAGAPVEVTGWILDRTGYAPGRAAALIVRGAQTVLRFQSERCFDGEAAALAGSDIEAGFRALVDLGELPAGLYSLTPAVAESDGTWSGGEPAMFERCSPEDRAPNFLPFFKEPAAFEIEQLEPLRPVRGEPIVVRGWAIEPSGAGQGHGVYVRLGEHHFLPLPSALERRPDLAAANGASVRDDIGFAGIIDTAHVLPGVHHLDIVLSDAAGRGWYPLVSRDIEVI